MTDVCVFDFRYAKCETTAGASMVRLRITKTTPWHHSGQCFVAPRVASESGDVQFASRSPGIV
jgi:hypothetical protein